MVEVRTLLFVGRIYPVKALDRLIEAFQMMPHEGWRLRIVGPDQAGHLAELKKEDCRTGDNDPETLAKVYGTI